MDKKLSLTQLDLLKEIGTIGAGRAATALAELIAARVEISVPQTSLVSLEQIPDILGGAEQLFFVLDIGFEGDIKGRMFLLFLPKEARRLSSILIGKTPEEIDFNDDLFKSALKESANILCGSFISALAELTGMRIGSSVPSLAMDMVGAILDFIFIQIAETAEEALYIKTDLKIKGLQFDGFFLFFPYAESLFSIFNALGLKQ
ncbi:MAG: chemotaxis protein CheC [Candidatus Omnitrophota bacterium]